jgi:hypothetical protein
MTLILLINADFYINQLKKRKISVNQQNQRHQRLKKNTPKLTKKHPNIRGFAPQNKVGNLFQILNE